MKRPRRRRPLKTIAPVHPNAGITAAYRRRLLDLIERMHESVLFWIGQAYQGEAAPIMALDAGGRPPRLMRITPAQLGRMIQVAQGESPRRGRPLDYLIREGLARETKAGGYELTPEGAQVLQERLRAEGTTLRGLRSTAEPFLAITAPGEPLPAEVMTRAVAALTTRWQGQFEAAAPRLADYFATAVEDRTDGALQSILREGGFSVRFQPTPGMLNAVHATTAENVALIKSIPQQYLTQVEGMVLRSVTAGRDLGTLAKDIEHQYGVTKRRAALIARDQNNKATATLTRVRHQELGINQAIWQHSAGGREPRPTHVANSGKPYDVATGWYDPAVKKYIHPGELINCRCVSRPVIPGLL